MAKEATSGLCFVTLSKLSSATCRAGSVLWIMLLDVPPAAVQRRQILILLVILLNLRSFLLVSCKCIYSHDACMKTAREPYVSSGYSSGKNDKGSYGVEARKEDTTPSNCAKMA